MATLGSHGRGKKKSKRKNASGNRAHGSKWKAKTAEKEENKQMFEQESQKSEEKAKEFEIKESKESNKLNKSQKAKKPKESKEFTEAKQSTEATESKETKEPKESKESKESSESTQSSNNNNNNNNNNNDNNNFDDVDSTVKLLNEHLDRRWNNMLALNKKRKSKRKGMLRYNKLTIYYWLLNDFNHNIGQQKDYQIEIFKQLKKSFANKSDLDQRWNAGDYVRREWMYQGGKKFETNCFDSIEHCLELVETFEPLYKYYK